MDRGTKLLLRQRGRGKRLRNLLFDVPVIIRTPVREVQDESFQFNEQPRFDEPPIDEVPTYEAPIDDAPIDEAPHYNEPPNIEYSHVLDDDEYNEQPKVDSPRGYRDDVSIAQQTKYNFNDIPLRQLSSSITSVTTIDVLISLFTDLFELDLIPQALNDFNSNTEQIDKLMSKLDLKIFTMVMKSMQNDLKDILDINVSNNELCYQLRQIVNAKEEMNENLVTIRSNLSKIKNGHDWYSLQKEHTKLKERIQLNNKLNQLNQNLLNNTEIVKKDLNISNTNLLSTTLDPYNGTIAKIDRINSILQKQLISNENY
ncbi:hypothetical protein Kpol_478p18 [Vanderwaltozyma polyspora DSM 70294]|uniref:Inner kinetochore subunit AME1 domain-containing protein n=1 Tax=Vanderwaltozyma polyspora (strain ATCC 22028 / DSM 70294 / BCRC 21397 / CBS 2163 / NBRC 10782 / NRRL Y-8283 / UCD 57-17) TaxID=436907 RepID=A7TPN7_VANPO|nr:uncharacterized protein Kpol_478p18 [Vanderwaltozyma polyspora DSM 70294]EDO15782.1 hypothetical protein Kpol_478p18 [Vanderwaltozyma polyspora DSM 70294]